MFQPSRAQWSLIWAVAVILILAWPPAEGRSLLVKIVNWAVDPANSLPTLPAPLAMGLDDNGDAVAAHDAIEADYYQARDRSALVRWRMDMKTARDPLAPATERQVLVGLAVLSALAVWRLDAKR
ncbi:MAG: hypothetical protein ABI665_22920 [Vicinamibacterales bacterium]